MPLLQTGLVTDAVGLTGTGPTRLGDPNCLVRQQFFYSCLVREACSHAEFFAAQDFSLMMEATLLLGILRNKFNVVSPTSTIDFTLTLYCCAQALLPQLSIILVTCY